MAFSLMNEVRRACLRGGTTLTDGQLLEAHLRQDEFALSALVHRHAPMVWSVCRRILRNPQDAEDAFQATFLVLVRKARSISSRELLANWLYGVARQTALKARATSAQRANREKQVPVMPEPQIEEGAFNDLPALVDAELTRLPSKLRGIIVLCDLEGKTRTEAARELGLPEGTVASRLMRARARLGKRLSRLGLAGGGGTIPVALSVPPSLVSSTIKAASQFAAGQVAAAGVAALTEGVLRAMMVTKLKAAAVAFVAVVLLAFGAGLLGYRPAAGQQPAGQNDNRPRVEVKDEATDVVQVGKRYRFYPEDIVRSEEGAEVLKVRTSWVYVRLWEAERPSEEKFWINLNHVKVIWPVGEGSGPDRNRRVK
jgi:RNA polymerase sigma factor (sigma-70 family)